MRTHNEAILRAEHSCVFNVEELNKQLPAVGKPKKSPYFDKIELTFPNPSKKCKFFDKKPALSRIPIIAALMANYMRQTKTLLIVRNPISNMACFLFV